MEIGMPLLLSIATPNSPTHSHRGPKSQTVIHFLCKPQLSLCCRLLFSDVRHFSISVHTMAQNFSAANARVSRLTEFNTTSVLKNSFYFQAMSIVEPHDANRNVRPFDPSISGTWHELSHVSTVHCARSKVQKTVSPLHLSQTYIRPVSHVCVSRVTTFFSFWPEQFVT